MQAQVVHQPTYEAKNRWLDQLKGTNEAADAFEDAVEVASGLDSARDIVSFIEAKEDASVQVIQDVVGLMLNAREQARQKLFNTAVMFVSSQLC
jgi:hypothetical protein